MSIRTNTMWNLVGSGAPLLAGILAVPYLLSQLGIERLGVLTLVWALIGYMSVFDFGLGRALTQRVSVLRAADPDHLLPGTLRAGLRLLVWLGLGAAVLLLLALQVVDVRWLKVSDAVAADAHSALIVAALSVPATTLNSGLKGVLEGLERFQLVNVLKLLLGLSNFLVPMAAVALAGPDLTAVVVGLVAARMAILLAHHLVVKNELRRFAAAPTQIQSGRVRELLAFGWWMTLSNIVSPLMVVADRFVVSGLLGAGLVAFYAVPSDLLIKLLVLPAALSTTLFPAFARLIASESYAIRTLYLRSLATTAAVMLPTTVIVMAGARPGLSSWLGPNFAAEATLVVLIMAPGILLNSLAQIPHALAQAGGLVRQTSVLHLAEFAFYLPLLYAATQHFGLGGAAGAWTARAAVDALALHLLARRLLGGGSQRKACAA